MEEKGSSAKKAKRPRNEIQQLIARCQAMDKELNDLKLRMLEIQRQVQNELERRRPQP